MSIQFNHFDLNLLRALDTLLAERNVTRAADRLCLTQQALSGALHRLREHFDDRLLVKVGREMELTPVGQALIEPVHSALLQIRAALETTPSFDPATARTVMRIAASDYPTFVILPRLVRQLAVDAPGVSLDVRMLDECSFAKLEAGDVDMCLAPVQWRLFGAYEPSRDIRTVELFQDDFVCAVDSANEAIGGSLDMATYLSAPHNSVQFGRGVTTWVQQSWLEAGLHLNIAATVPNFLTALYMIPGTPLVATVQRRLAAAFAEPLGLRVLECPFPVRPLTWHLAWHARSDDHPGHRYMRDAIGSAARHAAGA